MFLVGQVSAFVRSFHIGIFSDTINVINIKLCIIVLLIELYLYISISEMLTIYQGHSSVKQFYRNIFCS